MTSCRRALCLYQLIKATIMKQFIYILAIGSCCMAACTVGKKSTGATTGTMKNNQNLESNWEADYVAGGQPMETLYPNRKPTIHFDVAGNKINGNTSCNSFFGPLKVTGNSISFPESMGMTKMFCEGQGEQVFLSTLKTVNKFDVSSDGKALTLIRGDIAVMRLVRK
jgi:heat shock protein HslJ